MLHLPRNRLLLPLTGLVSSFPRNAGGGRTPDPLQPFDFTLSRPSIHLTG
jgi:hypothetical protein